MDIQLDYDSSTSRAPAGFATALQYAASQLDALITDPITVSITVSWNNSVLGLGGPENLEPYQYDDVVQALQAHAESPAAIEAADSLPLQDPTSDGYLFLSGAQAEALGLTDAAAAPDPEGQVTLGTGGADLNFSTTNLAIAGEIDFVGVAEHELTHALGRYSFGDPAPVSLMDLYRYSSPGILSSDPALPTYFSINDGVTNLANFATYDDYSDWATSVTDDSFDAISDAGVANTISAVDETLLSALGFDVACFAAGTRILTPRGAVPIEQLQIGDTLVTRFHGTQPIGWIGFRHYNGRFIRNNHNVLPVRIRAGALGKNIPSRDLLVSPGHAIYLAGALIPAARLVNGATIIQLTSVSEIAYYHLELPLHDVIFAEDCPAESYLEDNCRQQFHNAAEYFRLYPDPPAPAKPCLKRLEHGFRLQKLQRRINRRAGLAETPALPGPLRGFIDIAGPERVAGWAQTETDPERPVELDVVMNGKLFAHILANQYRADLRAAGLGSGTHGFDLELPKRVKMQSVEVRRASDQTPLPFTAAARAA
jgi:hypothetical protein